MSVSLSPLPAGPDFGVFECVRMAEADEMHAAHGACVQCGEALVAKHGGTVIPGAMIGVRSTATAAWAWTGPHCYSCEGEVATDFATAA